MPDYTPLPVPSPPKERKELSLSEEEQKKRDEILAYFGADDYRLDGEEKGELTDEEKMWLSIECLFRYLRATKWDIADTKKRLENTLKWRREYGLSDGSLTAEFVEPEAVTGKEVLFGYDTDRRPGFYMIPSRQNTKESPRQVQFNVWIMERCIDLMGPGVETLTLLINFADRGKNPSFGVARTVLNIIQSHYPERLGLSLIINVPLIVRTFFQLIMPFVDPATRPKIKFNPDVIADGIFAKDQVMQEWWGGDREFVYDHAKYWPALINICSEQREKQLECWRQLGAKVGLSEWDMKAGWAPSTIPDEPIQDEPIQDGPIQDGPIIQINGSIAEDPDETEAY